MKLRYLVNGIAVDLTVDQAQALVLKGLSVARTDSANRIFYPDTARELAKNALMEVIQ